MSVQDGGKSDLLRSRRVILALARCPPVLLCTTRVYEPGLFCPGCKSTRTHLINTPPATKGRTFRKHRLSKKARKRHLQCLRSVGAISLLTIYEMASRHFG